ncbi:hypothetical protein [Streptomyces turgidiscabies]|uniref:hypothetical protein n=1 Tax=Streptomyces turgidiscabies TaxID=85558 RepID=UPI00240F064E|nr:hypothetical protein [Streptomyces turgidiscabies]
MTPASTPPGAPAAPARTPSASKDAAPPRFPHLRAPSREADGPIAPPPPPSSARLPDAPPVAGGPTTPRPRPDLPPLPAHQPPVAPWRPAGLAHTEPETTRRLRMPPPRPTEAPPAPTRRPTAGPQTRSSDMPPTTPRTAPRTPDQPLAPIGRPYLPTPPRTPAARPGTAETPPAPTGGPRPANAPAGRSGQASSARPGSAEAPSTSGSPRPASAPAGRSGQASSLRPGSAEAPSTSGGPRPANAPAGRSGQASSARPGSPETPQAPAGVPRPANAPADHSARTPAARPGSAETPSVPADVPRPANAPVGRPGAGDASVGPVGRPYLADPPAADAPTRRLGTGNASDGRPYRPSTPRTSDARPGTAETPPAPNDPSRPASAPAGRPYLGDRPATDPPQAPTGRPGAGNTSVGRPYRPSPSPASSAHTGTAATPPAPANTPAGRPYLADPSTTGPSSGRPGAVSAPVGHSYRPNPPVADPSQGPGRRPDAGEMPAAPAGPPRPTNVPSAAGMPDPALSWSAPYGDSGTVGSGRPVVSLAQPDVYGAETRPRSFSGRALLAVGCAVLGLGLIGGALTGSWLTGDDSGDAGARTTFTAAGSLWHSVPVDQLFPPTVEGDGAGPGGADRTWIRIAVAPDTGCADAFDPLLRKALAPVGCQRLLRATYTDETQSYVTTVGLLFTKADAAAMNALRTRFSNEHLDRRTDLMPRPYAAKNTVADDFGDAQRASWTISVLTDAPVVTYAVSGWADGRGVDAPQPAEETMESGAATAIAQAGLGHEAKGLADRVERALRKTVGSAAKLPS